MGETGQVLVVTHLVENDSLTPSAVPLAPSASTLAFGCDFSGFAGMNGSPVQSRRIATPQAAPGTARGSWASIYRVLPLHCGHLLQGRATLLIGPHATLVFQACGLCFIVWTLRILL